MVAFGGFQHVVAWICFMSSFTSRGTAMVIEQKQPSAGYSPVPSIVNAPETEVVGINTEILPDISWFYDTFYTVVYEIEVPNWNASDLHLEFSNNLSHSLELFSCIDTSNTTDFWASTLCPITKKLYDILDEFAKELKIFENMNASSTRLDSYLGSCNEIKPHFSNHIIDEVEIDLYLIEVIMNCPMTEVMHKKLNVTRPNRTKYADIFKLFVETYISPKFRIMGYSKFAIATNTLLGLHTTQLLEYFLDTFQWTSSINTCNSQRIPKLFVPPEALLTTLEDISKKVLSKGYKLTIPTEDLSNYYKLKLADCIMTSGKTYIVRVLVPLTKSAANYQMVHVKVTPFLDRLDLGERHEEFVCRNKFDEGSYIIDGNTREPIAQTDCDPSELCMVPQEGDRKMFHICTYAALQNNTKTMQKQCALVCTHAESSAFPYVKRISSDMFVVVGSSSAEVAVKCRSMEKPLMILDPPKERGSLLVTLPCGCYLSHRNSELENDHGICSNKLEVRPIRPLGVSEAQLTKQYWHVSTMKIAEKLNISLRKIEFDEDSETESESYEDSGGPVVWPIYLAYFLIITICGGLLFGFYMVRNVYVRMGKLEVSTALTNTRSSTGTGRARYNRDAPVAFSVNNQSGFTNMNDSVY